ncbi:MAG: Oligopeptide transport system permease protein OppC [Chlamydiae bacterium]|nr:Oligopeptide transport system permease protein OppC [Chlamydiota bacterium]
MYELHPDLFSPLVQKTSPKAIPKVSQSSWAIFFKNPLAITCLTFLALVIFVALAGPFFSGHQFDYANLPMKNHPPSWRFWFGSDDLGRDVFTRLCYGARISLFIGFTAALIDLIVGVTWGATSAFVGGLFDQICMRLCDIFITLPKLLVVMILTLVLGSGLLPIIISIALIGWIPMARVVRGEVLAIKQQDYVLSGIAAGASYPRLLFKYLIPNMMSVITVATTMSIPKAMFLEAFLSFLGIGVQAPHASWGTMAHEALSGMLYYPWRLFFPAVLMSLTIICFNVIGDALQEA